MRGCLSPGLVLRHGDDTDGKDESAAKSPDCPRAAQILAGALASISAAIIASTFGVAGTLIGAALTSVIVIS